MPKTFSLIAILLIFTLLLPACGFAEPNQEPTSVFTADDLRSETIKSYADNGKLHQYIALGSYPQAEEGGTLPIIWRVLGIDQDGYALLFSEYVLFNQRVHGDFKQYVAFEGEFRKTEIWATLNGSFLVKAFTPAEQALLVDDDALGKVFLVAADDLRNHDYGMSTERARQGFGTPYALANGLFRYGNAGRRSSPYWMRTRSKTMWDGGGVNCTKVDGKIGYIRCVVMNEGIRPAIRLALQDGQLQVTDGDGSFDSPWTLPIP